MILFARTAAHSYRTNYFSIAFQRDAASKDHDATVTRNVNSEELAAPLASDAPDLWLKYRKRET
jgi:hypothetical protein